MSDSLDIRYAKAYGALSASIDIAKIYLSLGLIDSAMEALSLGASNAEECLAGNDPFKITLEAPKDEPA